MSSTAPSSFVVVQKGQIVSIITWILLVTSTLSIITRLTTKHAVSKRLHLDDLFACLALLFTFGSGAATIIESKHGLGENVNTLSSHQLMIFSKCLYAADLLYIATVCFAKLSIVLLINNITRRRDHLLLSVVLAGFIAVSSVACLIAAAFGCNVPETWNLFSRCYDKVAFWYAVGVINIITDLALVILPSYILMPLQLSGGRKAVVIGCFSFRLVDVGVTIVQLVYTRTYRSADLTLDLWSWVLVTQFVQCVTIVTSCIPYFRPLLESFPSGMFMSDELRRRGMSSTGSKYAVRTAQSSESHSSSSLAAGNRSANSYNKRPAGFSSNLIPPMAKLRNDEIMGHHHTASGSDAHIIKSTTFSVSYSNLHTDTNS